MTVAVESHAEIATDYAQSVVDGDIPACKYVRLACQRHLDDLDRQEDDDFGFYYDAEAANKVCRFVELMPHVKGVWANRGETIKLEPWQTFNIAVPFGWKEKDTGLRRFRRSYSEIPRKNAKSTKTAALGLYMFAADGEYGAEVYSGAGSEKQAWEVFGPARLMAKNTPELRSHYGIEVNAKNLHIHSNNSKFEPIIGKPGDGASPSFSITDEYHEHDTEEQYDTMVTGMGSREEPMAWVITTAGSDTSGPCYALRSEVVDVLEGNVKNERLFGIIYTIDMPEEDGDEGDDWTSVDALRKANPNMGVSVFEDYLRMQQQDAINNPRKQSTFKMKHLNVWVTAASPYFNIEKWNRLADSGLKLSDFDGETCFAGLDLSAKIDTTSYVKVFRQEEDGEHHYYVFGRTYVPEKVAEDPKNHHYNGWMHSGELLTAGTSRIDNDLIEADVRDDAERFPMMLGVDPWEASQTISHLQKHMGEDRVIEIPQTTNHLSEPMKEVAALIEDGCIHHDGNPVHTWMMGNVTAKADRNDNVFPRKEKDEDKIDFAVALFCAMAVALRNKPPPKSRYEEEGAEIGWI